MRFVIWQAIAREANAIRPHSACIFLKGFANQRPNTIRALAPLLPGGEYHSLCHKHLPCAHRP